MYICIWAGFTVYDGSFAGIALLFFWLMKVLCFGCLEGADLGGADRGPRGRTPRGEGEGTGWET